MKWGFSMTVNVKVEELKASILEYVDNKDKPNIHTLLEELERQIEYSMYTKSFDDIVEIPLIGERKTTSGLENCSVWLD